MGDVAADKVLRGKPRTLTRIKLHRFEVLVFAEDMGLSFFLFTKKNTSDSGFPYEKSEKRWKRRQFLV